MRNAKKEWIENGYTVVALYGFDQLKIDRLSKNVGKSKSSFYHLFGDADAFVTELLDYHEQQAHTISALERAATNEAELIAVLVEYKTDVLFNKRLRLKQEIEIFQKCIHRIDAFSLPALLPVWKKIIQLDESGYLAELVLHFSISNFYLQLSSEKLTKKWLQEYFYSVRSMIGHFKVLSVEGVGR